MAAATAAELLFEVIIAFFAFLSEFVRENEESWIFEAPAPLTDMLLMLSASQRNQLRAVPSPSWFSNTRGTFQVLHTTGQNTAYSSLRRLSLYIEYKYF